MNRMDLKNSNKKIQIRKKVESKKGVNVMLKKIKIGIINFLKMISEIFYEIIKKFLMLYYIIFIFGLLISIKNETIKLEVIVVSLLFLVFTQIYYKNYKKITGILDKMY
ncbi:MAG: hypothetical protein ACRC5T_12700 [Cetobacterium sp.]